MSNWLSFFLWFREFLSIVLLVLLGYVTRMIQEQLTNSKEEKE